MSVLITDGTDHAEKKILDNWAAEYARRAISEHRDETPIDHPDGSVTTLKIGDGAVSAEKLASASVTTAKLDDQAVTTDKIDDYAVTTVKIAQGAVNNDRIASGAVDERCIADDAVTTDKLADKAVTGDNIADNTINAANMAPNAIKEAAIEDGAVTTEKIADYAVGQQQLAQGAVSNNRIQNDAVDERCIAPGSVGFEALKVASVGNAAIIPGCIQNRHMADDSIGTDELINGAVTGIKIATDAIIWQKIANGAVITDKIADGAVTAEKLAEEYAKSAGSGSTIQNVDLDTLTQNGIYSVYCDHEKSEEYHFPQLTVSGGIEIGAHEGSIIVTENLDGCSQLYINYGMDSVGDDTAKPTIAYRTLNNNSGTWIVDSDWKFTDDIADGSVTTDKVADYAITQGKLAQAAVLNNRIASGAVDARCLASNAVTTDKVADKAITAAKIADGVIPSAALITYSNTPQRIGTWIDGTPVWRLAFDAEVAADATDEITIKYAVDDDNVRVLLCKVWLTIAYDGATANNIDTTELDQINATTYYNPSSAPGTLEIIKGSATPQNRVYGYIDYATPESNLPQA